MWGRHNNIKISSSQTEINKQSKYIVYIYPTRFGLTDTLKLSIPSKVLKGNFKFLYTGDEVNLEVDRLVCIFYIKKKNFCA
jgi:hypothetical protein